MIILKTKIQYVHFYSARWVHVIDSNVIAPLIENDTKIGTSPLLIGFNHVHFKFRGFNPNMTYLISVLLGHVIFMFVSKNKQP